MKHDEQCWKNQSTRELGVGYKIASCTCGLDALLRVARAAKAFVYTEWAFSIDHCPPATLDKHNKLIEALKEVEDLLK